MIVGIGVDLVEIKRIRQLIDRFGDAFLHKVFTPLERQEGMLRYNPAPYFAGRWAVKEAVAKALGCGIGADCGSIEVETCNGTAGKPVTRLSGNAAKTMEKLGGKNIHISLSHEANYAIAYVILEN